jgi:cytochrome c-type biogenesis protein CcmH
MLVAVLTSCDQNVRPLSERPTGSRVPMAGILPSARPNEGNMPTMQQGAGGSISGTIAISPELAGRLKGSEIMFIMARSGGGGAPVAVKRLGRFQFPLRYDLSSADQMVQGSAFSGNFEVVARIDVDGSAGPLQAGDMEGSMANVAVGRTDVDFVIDRLR